MKNKRKGYRIGTLGVHTYQEPSLQLFPMINIQTKQIRSHPDSSRDMTRRA